MSQSSSLNKDSLAPLYFTQSDHEKINQHVVYRTKQVIEDVSVEIKEKKQTLHVEQTSNYVHILLRFRVLHVDAHTHTHTVWFLWDL